MSALMDDFKAAWIQFDRALGDLQKATAAVQKTMSALSGFQPASPPPSKRDMMVEILSKGDLDILQIVQTLRDEGFAFSGRDPVGSTRSTLYKYKDLFKSEAGIFSLTPAAKKAHAAAKR